MTLLGGAAAWPVAARAQQAAMPEIGFLGSDSRDRRASRLRAFQQGLSETGYLEGRNVAIEYRWAEGQTDRLPAMAADLARRQVAVIASLGGIPSAMAAKAATQTIPVVFVVGGDPVELGLVASVNRPGSNLTGAITLNVELGPKRLELLHELVPMATVMALLVNPTNPNAEIQTRDTQAAARALGRQLHVLNAKTEHDFDAVFATLVQLRGALVVGAGAPFIGRSEQLAALAVRHAVPAIFQGGDFAEFRPDSQRREADRPTGAADHESRADHQPQDRQETRPHCAVFSHRPRQRGDRMRRPPRQEQDGRAVTCRSGFSAAGRERSGRDC